MFAGSDEGGKTAAVLYSIATTCKSLGIEPWGYLRDILTRLPEHPTERAAGTLSHILGCGPTTSGRQSQLNLDPDAGHPTTTGRCSSPDAYEVREELRKLIGYFEKNEHRTDYPNYRKKGWDIGSGPTEAGCKIIGVRLKASGMRWVEDGAAPVAARRALYVSSGKLWDGFWEQPYRTAA